MVQGEGVGVVSSKSTSAQGSAAELAGDACLLAAAAIPLGPLALLIGPVGAWLLHGRSLSKRVALGAAFGLVAGLVVVGALIAALAFALNAAGLGGDNQNTIPLILVGIVAAAFLAAVISLDIDAIRDLAPTRRAHARLDVVRLILTAVLLVGGVSIFLVQRANPGSEIADAVIFSLASGAVAAITTYVATKYAERSTGAAA